MRKMVLLGLLALVPVVAQAQTEIQRATLMSAFDLDGEAADADQVVTTANGDLLDSKTFTITAQPDSCRLIDMTVTDANSSLTAGVITVTGTGCLGEAKVCTFTFAAGGSGVKSFTCADGEGAYYAAITTIITGVLTGEGGAGVDFASIGYTANSVNGWRMHGTRFQGANGEFGINPFGYIEIPHKITTSGVASTSLAGVVGAEDAFALAKVGDILEITIGGQPYERLITTYTSADLVVVNSAINIATAGVTYRLRPSWFSTNPAHQMFIPVHGYRDLLLNWSVDANVNTGGVITLFQCIDRKQPDFPTGPWVTISTTTVASTVAQVPTAEAVNLELLPYQYCRFGIRLGTGDDADAAVEDINASITLMR